MQIFIEAIDLNVWDEIKVGPYIPTMVAGITTIEKPREYWSEE